MRSTILKSLIKLSITISESVHQFIFINRFKHLFYHLLDWFITGESSVAFSELGKHVIEPRMGYLQTRMNSLVIVESSVLCKALATHFTCIGPFTRVHPHVTWQSTRVNGAVLAFRTSEMGTSAINLNAYVSSCLGNHFILFTQFIVDWKTIENYIYRSADITNL